MDKIARSDQSELRSQIWTFSTAQLRERLEKLITITVDTLTELAEVWVELERRGEDLSTLRSGLMSYVRMIARREVLPEAVVRFAGHRHIMIKLTEMPLRTQAKLLRKPEVELVTLKGTVSRPLHLLTPNEAELALDRSGNRPLRAQRAIVKSAKERLPANTELGYRTVVIPFTGAEYEAFKRHARHRKCSMGNIIRGSLLTAGVLKP